MIAILLVIVLAVLGHHMIRYSKYSRKGLIVGATRMARLSCYLDVARTDVQMRKAAKVHRETHDRRRYR